MKRLLVFIILAAAVGGFAAINFGAPSEQSAETKTPASVADGDAIAIFAGGCFWCVEADFEKLDGVFEAVSGYTGGDVENPTYKQVTYEKTGHVEAVKVRYDPAAVTYRELVDYFFRHVDPLDEGGQFCDRGHSYVTGIFVRSDDQRRAAEASLNEAQEILGKKVVTPVTDAKKFWPAEEYHQDYYKKNPVRYALYRNGCGRDRRVRQLWGSQS